MKRWQDSLFWQYLTYVGQQVVLRGREVERSLQISSGTLLLTVIASLPSAWPIEPPRPLALIYIGAGGGFGFAFLLALTATFHRFMTFDVDRSTGSTRYLILTRVGLWLTAMILSLGTMIATGAYFFVYMLKFV